jgi:putative flippase GtrA
MRDVYFRKYLKWNAIFWVAIAITTLILRILLKDLFAADNTLWSIITTALSVIANLLYNRFLVNSKLDQLKDAHKLADKLANS